jgi:hypothetical protein
MSERRWNLRSCHSSAVGIDENHARDGSYHSVVALARLVRNVPAAQTTAALARLLELMADEEDSAALGEVVACARWITREDAAALFVAQLNQGRMHQSGLVGLLSDAAGLGALAPLLAAVGDDAADAVARLVCDSTWFA